MVDIKFQGEMTKDILQRGSRLLRKRKKTRFLTGFFVFIFISSVATAFAALTYSNRVDVPLDESFDGGTALLAILGYLAPALIFFVGIMLFASFSSRNARWKNKPTLRGIRSGTVTAEQLHFVGENFDTTVAWSGFSHCRVSADLVLLYVGRQAAHFLPKEFFATEQDWQALLAFVREKLTEK